MSPSPYPQSCENPELQNSYRPFPISSAVMTQEEEDSDGDLNRIQRLRCPENTAILDSLGCENEELLERTKVLEETLRKLRVENVQLRKCQEADTQQQNACQVNPISNHNVDLVTPPQAVHWTAREEAEKNMQNLFEIELQKNQEFSDRLRDAEERSKKDEIEKQDLLKKLHVAELNSSVMHDKEQVLEHSGQRIGELVQTNDDLRATISNLKEELDETKMAVLPSSSSRKNSPRDELSSKPWWKASVDLHAELAAAAANTTPRDVVPINTDCTSVDASTTAGRGMGSTCSDDENVEHPDRDGSDSDTVWRSVAHLETEIAMWKKFLRGADPRAEHLPPGHNCDDFWNLICASPSTTDPRQQPSFSQRTRSGTRISGERRSWSDSQAVNGHRVQDAARVPAEGRQATGAKQNSKEVFGRSVEPSSCCAATGRRVKMVSPLQAATASQRPAFAKFGVPVLPIAQVEVANQRPVMAYCEIGGAPAQELQQAPPPHQPRNSDAKISPIAAPSKACMAKTTPKAVDQVADSKLVSQSAMSVPSAGMQPLPLSSATSLLSTSPKESSTETDSARTSSAVPTPKPSGKGCPPKKAPPPFRSKGPPYPKAKVPEPRKPDVVPCVQVKKLYWNPLRSSDFEADTVWNSVHGDLPIIDTEALENLFTDEAPGNRPRRSSTFSEEASVSKYQSISRLQVLDTKRRQAMCVMLARLPDKFEVISALLTGERQCLHRDNVELLLMNVPTQDEVKLLRNAGNTYDVDENTVWDVAESFLIDLMEVPLYELKLHAWNFENTFQERCDAFADAENAVSFGCNSLLESETIRRLLGIILMTGNFLNGGTPRGRADGFSIEMLGQIRNVKMSPTRRKGTLIDFIIDEMETRSPGALDGLFMPGCSALRIKSAARFKLSDLEQEFETYKSSACDLLKSLQEAGDDTLQEDASVVAIMVEELHQLKTRFDALAQRYVKLLEWFQMDAGNSSKRLSTFEFFGIWDGFLNDVQQALQSRQERLRMAVASQRQLMRRCASSSTSRTPRNRHAEAADASSPGKTQRRAVSSAESRAIVSGVAVRQPRPSQPRCNTNGAARLCSVPRKKSGELSRSP